MRDLTLLPVSMTSREIAELLEVKHYHLLAIIRKEIHSLAAGSDLDDDPNIGSSTWPEGITAVYTNQGYVAYLTLNRRYTLFITAKFNAKLRMAVIDRMEQMEIALLQVMKDKEEAQGLLLLHNVHNMAMEAARQISEEKEAQRKLRAERTLLRLELYQLKQRGRRIR